MIAEEKGSKWPGPESSCSRVMTIGSCKLSLVNWHRRSLVYPQAGRRLHLIRRRVGGDDLAMVLNTSMELIRHAVYPISFRSMGPWGIYLVWSMGFVNFWSAEAWMYGAYWMH